MPEDPTILLTPSGSCPATTELDSVIIPHGIDGYPLRRNEVKVVAGRMREVAGHREGLLAPRSGVTFRGPPSTGRCDE
jgi:hypothetical protein